MSKRFSLLSMSMEQNSQVDYIEDLEDAPEEVIKQETAYLSQEIQEEMNDNERVLDTVEALESLLETVSDMPEDLSETDQAMIRNTLDMAVAGTDITVTDLNPGLESFTTKTLALEGIVDTIRDMVGSIQNSNLKILDNSERLLTTFKTQVTKIRDRLNVFKKELGFYENNSKREVNIYLGRFNKSQQGFVKDKNSFLKAYYSDSRELRNILELVMDNASVIDGMMSSTIGSFRSVETYYNVMNENFRKLRSEFLVPFTKIHGMKRTANDDTSEVFHSQALLGMERLKIGVPKTKDLLDLNNKAVSAAIDAIEMKFSVDLRDSEEWKGKNISFSVLTSSELREFFKDFEKTLDLIDEFTASEARSIKNRRNLLGNIFKVILGVGGGLAVSNTIMNIAVKAGVVAGVRAGGLLGASVGGLAGAGIGAAANYKMASPVIRATKIIGEGAGQIEDAVSGYFFNSLRLHYKTTKIYNMMTNGLIENMIDRLNLGYGVISKAVK